MLRLPRSGISTGRAGSACLESGPAPCGSSGGGSRWRLGHLTSPWLPQDFLLAAILAPIPAAEQNRCASHHLSLRIWLPETRLLSSSTPLLPAPDPIFGPSVRGLPLLIVFAQFYLLRKPSRAVGLIFAPGHARMKKDKVQSVGRLNHR